MVLATVGTSNDRLRLIEGQIPEEKPGWFVELSRRTAAACGAKVAFAFMPWARALDMVKKGNVAGAFNSSYKLSRVGYGVYPMHDGKPDLNRAAKHYSYNVYVSGDSTDSALLSKAELSGRTIVAERQASIIPLLKKRGAKVIEVASYISMLRVVASKRVDGAVGISANLDPILQRHPDLLALIKKVPVPVKKSIGYVMFSKLFYAQHKKLVECFWQQMANLRNTEWYKQLREDYR